MERRPLASTARQTSVPRRAITVPAPTAAPTPAPRARRNGTAHAPQSTSRFVPTGGMMLDCVLAGSNEPGGYGKGRIVNIVGDRSTGKTLLAVEACANFAMIAPVENIRYVEAESAFDEDYGQVVGMPAGIHPIDTIRTVEQFFNDLAAFCETQKKNPYPCLYVLDSLDALSDDSELKRKITDGSYGAEKAKLLSEAFRRCIKDITEANCTLIIISQVRDRIGVMFGEKHSRSGGKALDFYASQVIMLAEIEKIKRTVAGVERIIGVGVRIRNRKNKLGPAYREAEQLMLFGYGIDDEASMLKWLDKSNVLDKAAIKQWNDAVYTARSVNDRGRITELNKLLRDMVWQKWTGIEQQLAPVGRKYS